MGSTTRGGHAAETGGKENSTTAAMTATSNCCDSRIAKQQTRRQTFFHMSARGRISSGITAPRTLEECGRCLPVRHGRADNAMNTRRCKGLQASGHHTQDNVHHNLHASQMLAPRPLEPHGRERLAPDPIGQGVISRHFPGLLSPNYEAPRHTSTVCFGGRAAGGPTVARCCR